MPSKRRTVRSMQVLLTVSLLGLGDKACSKQASPPPGRAAIPESEASRSVEHFAGSDFGSRVERAIADCAGKSDTCIVDARNLNGPQTISHSLALTNLELLLGRYRIQVGNGVVINIGTGANIQGTSTSGTVFQMGKQASLRIGHYDAPMARRWKLADLLITPSAAGLNERGIIVDHASEGSIDHVQVAGFKGTGSCGIEILSQVYTISTADLWATNNDTGLCLHGAGLNAININHGVFGANGIGILGDLGPMGRLTSFSVTGSTIIEANTIAGIELRSGTYNGFNVTNVYGEDDTAHGGKWLVVRSSATARSACWPGQTHNCDLRWPLWVHMLTIDGGYINFHGSFVPIVVDTTQNSDSSEVANVVISRLSGIDLARNSPLMQVIGQRSQVTLLLNDIERTGGGTAAQLIQNEQGGQGTDVQLKAN
jgi:hypothetical protein